MRANSRALTAVLIALAGGFLYGLWRLYELRFAAGDIYPPYSSLRADPLGAKALYESIGAVRGWAVERNYLAIAKVAKKNATVLILGQGPFTFEVKSAEELMEFETLASAGARIVIAMLPVSRLKSSKNEPTPPTPLEKRWGIRFEYIARPPGAADEESSAPGKLSALYFRYEGKVVREVEKRFGSGSVMLVANSYPFSNEALSTERDTELLARALGSNRLVVFDERHLGMSEDASVMMLARRYRLQGMAATLAVLLALFLWKNSTSFLPRRNEASREDSIEAKDAASGLANLLRRNIPKKTLMKTCLEQWEASRYAGRFYPEAKIERVRMAVESAEDPVQAYREVSKILAERSYR